MHLEGIDEVKSSANRGVGRIDPEKTKWWNEVETRDALQAKSKTTGISSAKRRRTSNLSKIGLYIKLGKKRSKFELREGGKDELEKVVRGEKEGCEKEVKEGGFI